eukprot:maker-scaffold232_size243569-snap-gene-0.15 protein:Tk07011 transcript:maker-scaffold232_size243569-snap-gene-0.15-mRNA-1 annotation:"geranylgeranyl pyrophosphate synthase isoform x1"
MSANEFRPSFSEPVESSRMSHKLPKGFTPSGDVPLPLSKSNDVEQDQKLLEPYAYVLQVSGKDVRGKLLAAFNVWLDIPEDKLKQIGEIVKMLHNASLLLDDIQDNSVLRRGIPVAHKICGEPSTINAANYVMFIALERTMLLGHPEAVQVFTEQMLELHRGQGMDIFWRDNNHCPSEEEYREMTIRKTGGLFNLAVRLMQLFAKHPLKSDFAELGKLFGLYFQVRDDYANLCLKDYSENKSFAEDLTEGKFSFPIIHAISKGSSGRQIRQILGLRTTEVEVKKYCIGLLEKSGSFDYTQTYLTNLDVKVRSEIRELGGNHVLEQLLDELKDWMELKSWNNDLMRFTPKALSPPSRTCLISSGTGSSRKEAE